MIATTPLQKRTPPDDAWVVQVCRIGQGAATCRYLLMGRTWSCAKSAPAVRASIDIKAKRPGWTAQSDNCEGRAE